MIFASLEISFFASFEKKDFSVVGKKIILRQKAKYEPYTNVLCCMQSVMIGQFHTLLRSWLHCGQRMITL